VQRVNEVSDRLRDCWRNRGNGSNQEAGDSGVVKHEKHARRDHQENRYRYPFDGTTWVTSGRSGVVDGRAGVVDGRAGVLGGLRRRRFTGPPIVGREPEIALATVKKIL
jgi:hypothetical protein